MKAIYDVTRGPLFGQIGRKLRPEPKSLGDPDVSLEECGCCGAVIGPCIDWPWHYDGEDCRAIRKPTSEE
jgi:hypothetical protein